MKSVFIKNVKLQAQIDSSKHGPDRDHIYWLPEELDSICSELSQWRELAAKTHVIFLETYMHESNCSAVRWFLEGSKQLYPELEKIYDSER